MGVIFRYFCILYKKLVCEALFLSKLTIMGERTNRAIHFKDSH